MATNLTSEATVTAMIKAITDPISDETSRKYTKPSGGIPKTDLAQSVQASLGRADAAVQHDDVFNEGGKVRGDLLPSYVDDVMEYESAAYFPETGESGKIYVANDTNKTYRWGGSGYVEISKSLALGETSSTAFRGDHGKVAYDHATDANRLTTAQTSGLYKIATTAEGHVKSVTAVVKSDITNLGIPAQDTTYSEATTSEAGLMSAADKTKLEGVDAKLDKKVSIAEAEAGFTKWTLTPNTLGSAPLSLGYDGSTGWYVYASLDGELYDIGHVVGDADATSLTFIGSSDWQGEDNLTATRTRLPTMADLAAKQDTIPDLASIRSGAANGAAIASPLGGTAQAPTGVYVLDDPIPTAYGDGLIGLVHVNWAYFEGSGGEPGGWRGDVYETADFVVPLGSYIPDDLVVTVTNGSDTTVTARRVAPGNGNVVAQCAARLAQTAIVAAYDGYATTYAIGDTCTRNGVYYRCTAATSGLWDPSCWTPITIESVIATKQDALSAAQLSNIAAVPNKADSSALRYSLVSPEVTYTTTTTTDDTAAVTLQDRACNKVVLGAGVAECTITFPAAVEGKVRDFELRLTVAAGGDPEISFVGGDLENGAGEMPALALDDSAAATTLFMFSETEEAVAASGNDPAVPAKFLVRGEEMKSIASAVIPAQGGS